MAKGKVRYIPTYITSHCIRPNSTVPTQLTTQRSVVIQADTP